jgi:hypothetical protein
VLIFRCTQKLAKRLRVEFEDSPEPGESLLGAWYANLLPDFPEVGTCINERTRLAVLVELPRRPKLEHLVEGFRGELGWLLLELGLSGRVIQQIMDEYAGGVRIAHTHDRSLLGTMSNFADMAGYFIDAQLDSNLQVDLRSILPQLNQAPLNPLEWASAIDKLYELCSTAERSSGS